MCIALIGARGQLGTALRPLLDPGGVFLGQDEIDIADQLSVETALKRIRPESVINAAAYNFVDRAEEEPERAYAVNALGPRNVARYCAEHDIPLMHISSDYVFGLDATRSRPYTEDDAPGPSSAYGVSKLAGEYFVQTLCRKHFVVRTCGLFGSSSGNGKRNFVETMLWLADQRDELRIVDDQRCSPTSTADLAPILMALINTKQFGLYHATNSGETTWHGFAEEIFRQAHKSVRIIPVTSAEFGAQARRPSYSVLDNHRLVETIETGLPDWRDALARYLRQRSTS